MGGTCFSHCASLAQADYVAEPQSNARCPPPPRWATLHTSPPTLPTIMRHDSTRQRGELKPMDVTCKQDLVEIQVGMLAVHSPPSQLLNAAYTSLLSPRPLPTIMRRDSAPQKRQFKPMDVTRNQDLVEIWIEMLAPPPPRWT
jgi:hypothetical protein